MIHPIAGLAIEGIEMDVRCDVAKENRSVSLYPILQSGAYCSPGIEYRPFTRQMFRPKNRWSLWIFSVCFCLYVL
jgi:hypothetical protein